ncbi:hypothetical protein ACWEF6_20470 [Amycolatopsis sp. NPDC004772]
MLDDLTDWDGRILVDATNDFSAPFRPAQITTSEKAAALAPAARVLKASVAQPRLQRRQDCGDARRTAS